MPAYDGWSYYDIEIVARDVEQLTESIYQTMDGAGSDDPAYQETLRNALTDLVGAAQNFSDAVQNGSDYSDSLYDLFYLDDMATQAKVVLQDSSQAYLVDDQMIALRSTIDELLWNYKQNY